MGAVNAILNDRYRLERLLGRGGFASVFLATDLRLRRQVAVKILDPGLVALPQHADFLARFEREAQSVAALDHPNILGIHDYGESGGCVYLVMPHVEGGTLDDRQRAEGRLSLARVAAYLTQAASALDYAHQHGIVHRDIKPHNMLVRTDNDRLLLADFGIAKVLKDTTAATSRSAAIGTLAYMAPEQFRGEVTPAVDIYALGCVLFQLITGTVPYGGTTEQILYGHMMGNIPSVVERAQGRIPEALGPILERALAKSPHDRFASAGELAHAFSAALDGQGGLPPHEQVTQYAPPSRTVPQVSPAQPSLSEAGQSTRIARTRKAAWGISALSLVAVVLVGLITAALLKAHEFGGGQPTIAITATRLVAAPIRPADTATIAIPPQSSSLPAIQTATVPPLSVLQTATPGQPTPTRLSTSTAIPSPTFQPTIPTGPTVTSVRALPALASGQIYRDSQRRYSFLVPNNWSPAQPAGAEVAFQSPIAAGMIPATVNITIEVLPSQSVTLEEYAQAGAANLKQQFPDYRSVALDRVIIGERAALKLVFSATIGGRLLQLQQVVVIDQGIAYIMSEGCPQQDFANYAAVFDQIAGSLSIPSR